MAASPHRAPGPAPPPAGRVVLLASNLGDVFEVRVQTDSVIYYNQQFIKAFRAARLDSTRNWSGHPVWLATNRDWPGGLKLASILANTGLLLRHAGHLPAAFRYYEQAAALYQQLQLPSGQLWAQSPLAEAYAEQGDEPQASAAYRQALRTACALMQQTGNPSELAELLLDWYQPLLLRQPQRAGEARQLANEVEQDILRNQQALHLTASLRYTLIMARLELLRAELSLRAGQSAAELAWAAEWLEQPVVKDQRPPSMILRFTTSPTPWKASCLAGKPGISGPPTPPPVANCWPALLPAPGTGYVWDGRHQLLAGYALAMGEPAAAIRLLRPLTTLYHQQGNAFALSQVDGLLTPSLRRHRPLRQRLLLHVARLGPGRHAARRPAVWGAGRHRSPLPRTRASQPDSATY